MIRYFVSLSIGMLPKGKAVDFGSTIQRFESFQSRFLLVYQTGSIVNHIKILYLFLIIKEKIWDERTRTFE